MGMTKPNWISNQIRNTQLHNVSKNKQEFSVQKKSLDNLLKSYPWIKRGEVSAPINLFEKEIRQLSKEVNIFSSREFFPKYYELSSKISVVNQGSLQIIFDSIQDTNKKNYFIEIRNAIENFTKLKYKDFDEFIKDRNLLKSSLNKRPSYSAEIIKNSKIMNQIVENMELKLKSTIENCTTIDVDLFVCASLGTGYYDEYDLDIKKIGNYRKYFEIYRLIKKAENGNIMAYNSLKNINKDNLKNKIIETLKDRYKISLEIDEYEDLIKFDKIQFSNYEEYLELKKNLTEKINPNYVKKFDEKITSKVIDEVGINSLEIYLKYQNFIEKIEREVYFTGEKQSKRFNKDYTEIVTKENSNLLRPKITSALSKACSKYNVTIDGLYDIHRSKQLFQKITNKKHKYEQKIKKQTEDEITKLRDVRNKVRNLINDAYFRKY